MFTVRYLRLIISFPGRQCFFDIEYLHLLLRPNASHSILSVEFRCCREAGTGLPLLSQVLWCSSLQLFSSRESEGPCDLSPPLCPSVGCALDYGIACSLEGTNVSYRLKTSDGAYTRGYTAKQIAAGLKIILF